MSKENNITRRKAVGWFMRGSIGVLIAAVVAKISGRSASARLVWQIDPRKCIQCGKCETACVLQQSAVKCVHAIEMCGYCKLCFGYFKPDAPRLDEAAENQICPVGALKRKFIEPPYFEYSVDEKLCTGCGLCVKGCTNFGNGSLYLQVRHNLCVHCNSCRIAEVCPSNAFELVPENKCYLLKEKLPREVS